MNIRLIGVLVKRTLAEWDEDRVPRLGAALAYYSVFSLAPLLLVAIAIAGLVFGREAAEGQIVEQIAGLVGADAARAIEAMIEKASQPASGIAATLIGVVLLLFGATG